MSVLEDIAINRADDTACQNILITERWQALIKEKIVPADDAKKLVSYAVKHQLSFNYGVPKPGELADHDIFLQIYSVEQKDNRMYEERRNFVGELKYFKKNEFFEHNFKGFIDDDFVGLVKKYWRTVPNVWQFFGALQEADIEHKEQIQKFDEELLLKRTKEK